MKRWRAAFLLAFLAALPILFAANRSAALLEDSDTKGILAAIRAVHDPFKWFRGDWPIENGFYRPIASLVFEADNALWGDRAAGYGLTNAALCFACILLLFWALREITDRPWPSALGAGLFAVWHVGPLNALTMGVEYLAWATLLIGAWRHQRDWRRYVPGDAHALRVCERAAPHPPPGRTDARLDSGANRVHDDPFRADRDRFVREVRASAPTA